MQVSFAGIIAVILGLSLAMVLARRAGVVSGLLGLLALLGLAAIVMAWTLVSYQKARVDVRRDVIAVPEGSVVTIARQRQVPPANRPDRPADRTRPVDAAPTDEGDVPGGADSTTEGSDAPVPVSTDAKRPDWVDAAPGVVDGVYRMAVTSGPYKTREECDLELDQKLQDGVEQYAARRLGEEAASRISLPPDYLRRTLVKQQWLETVVSRTPAIGSMVQLHALLGFDRDAVQRIDEAWRQVLVAGRIRTGAIGLGGILLVLLVAYGYLKTDLATGGAYRGRLRLAAVATILGVVAAAMAAAAT